LCNSASLHKILDSGAFDHICTSLQLFESYITVTNVFVSSPNGQSVKVTHKGTIKLNDRLLLSNVFFVPSFHFNLVSISKLVQHLNCKLIFQANFCLIQDTMRQKMIGLASLHHGLYYLSKSTPIPVHQSSCFLGFPRSLLWHYRVGHVSNRILKNIEHFSSMVMSTDHDACTVCPIAKQYILSFPISLSTSNAAFDLIYIDI
jgi:hypothetical protein